jgi:hypothetical protein
MVGTGRMLIGRTASAICGPVRSRVGRHNGEATTVSLGAAAPAAGTNQP